MKKIGKHIKTAVMVSGVSMLMATSVLAAPREVLYGGKCTWTGGQNGASIYSQFVDNKNDKYYYYGTVYVKNDKGQRRSKTGRTTGVGSSGKVRVMVGETHALPFTVNKAWYEGIKQKK